MSRRAVFIDRRLSAILGALAVLVLDGVLAWNVALGVASGYLPPRDEGAFGVLKGIFCLWLVTWVIVAIFVYALAKVVLWIEIGDQITFRSLLRVRTLPWSVIARFEMRDRNDPPHVLLEGVVVEWFSRRVLGIKGGLHITTTDGEELETWIKFPEWTQLKGLEAERRGEISAKRIRLSLGRAIGLLAGGLAALAVWIYAAYLVCSGDKLLTLVKPHGPKTWVGVVVLAIIWPIGGCAACIIGARHLARRHRQVDAGLTTEPCLPPRPTRS